MYYSNTVKKITQLNLIKNLSINFDLQFMALVSLFSKIHDTISEKDIIADMYYENSKGTYGYYYILKFVFT